MISLIHPLLSEYWPITQTFAEHVEAAKHMQRPYNGGIDYGCPTGTPVYAAAPGTVIRAGQDTTGYGNHVRIQHPDGYTTIYGHLDSIVVGSGQTVTAGQMIGRSDSTGNSTGPHLHFELRHGSNPVDPQPYLDGVKPAPVPPDSLTWPDFPTLQRARVLVPNLNVRGGPGIDFPINGYLIQGNDPEIIRMKPDDAGNPWVQIGWAAWCCWQYNGETLMEWID